MSGAAADHALADKSVRRQLARTHRIDRTWDIPYLGGYSSDGGTIYLDRHLPKLFSIRSRKVSLDPFLVLHEEVEKVMIDLLHMAYLPAHEIATREEERAVRAAGISIPWYRAVLKPFIKSDAKKALLRVPADLDPTPYQASPVDERLLQRMKRAQKHPEPAGKIQSDDAEYGPGHAMGDHCGICGYFQPPTGCTVLGKAKADMWCKYFTKAYSERASNERSAADADGVHRAS